MTTLLKILKKMNKYLAVSLILLSSFAYSGEKSCKDPIKVNKTTHTWNKYDLKHLDIAKKRCPTITKGRSPCLKYFIKKTPSDYNAICSGFWYKDMVQ